MDKAMVETPKTKRERKSWSAILEDASGARLQVKLQRRKDEWRVSAQHIVGKGKSRKTTRGASSSHPDEAAARAAQDALVAASLKAGWTKRESKHAFTAKPDAWDINSIPPAKKAKK
jgi:hypothetical protein